MVPVQGGRTPRADESAPTSYGSRADESAGTHGRWAAPTKRTDDRPFVGPNSFGRGVTAATIAAMEFQVTARCGAARRGTPTLAHGTVETPVFMPVGTYGTANTM